jgi:glycosyltransferase involved in cell wall biosynthesis
MTLETHLQHLVSAHRIAAMMPPAGPDPNSKPIKVLQLLSNPGIGGTETFVLGLAPRLRKLGMDAQIANLWDGGGEMGQFAAKADIPFTALNAGTRRFRLGALFTLRRFLRANDFDVVMAYGLRTTLLLRFARPIGHRPVLVTGLRGLDAWRRWQHVWADRLTQPWMDYFVGVSQSVCRRRIEREHTWPGKVLCIPNGIDTEHFRRDAQDWPGREALKLPRGRLCVTVGNLFAVKGYPFQIDIIARLGAAARDVQFVWVGKGPEEAMLREMAASKGVAGRITFYGAAEDVRPILAHAEIFVLSSMAEGMPRAMMEAMAMGLPVLATDVGGNREVVRDGVDGLIVPYGDVEGAAAALKGLIDNPGPRARFAASSAQRIRNDFSFDAIARRYAELYQRLARGDSSVSKEFGLG